MGPGLSRVAVAFALQSSECARLQTDEGAHSLLTGKTGACQSGSGEPSSPSLSSSPVTAT